MIVVAVFLFGLLAFLLLTDDFQAIFAFSSDALLYAADDFLWLYFRHLFFLWHVSGFVAEVPEEQERGWDR